MTTSRRLTGIGVALALAVAGVTLAPATAFAAPVKYRNCGALHRMYPHGVARAGATDRVRGRTRPVTTFTVDPAAYRANARLDADRDGVACEQR